jgi:hypothetical protein
MKPDCQARSGQLDPSQVHELFVVAATLYEDSPLSFAGLTIGRLT